MIITAEWLKNHNACNLGYHWFTKHYPCGIDHNELIPRLLICHKDWAYWLMGRVGGTRFAIMCALEVFDDQKFVEWANAWLNGSDISEKSARNASLYTWNIWSNTSKEASFVAALATDSAWFCNITTYPGRAALWAMNSNPNIDLLSILNKSLEVLP